LIIQFLRTFHKSEPLVIRVCIAGVTGWVGRSLAPVIATDPEFALVGAVAPSRAGQVLVDALDLHQVRTSIGDLRISASVREALTVDTDVLIDYTTPDVVKANVMEAIGRNVHCVIGTSGISDDDYREIAQAAEKANVGVIAGGNFAISAVLLEYFALVAARHMPSWELIDYASSTKPDAPSGTVRQLAYRLSEVRMPRIDVPVDQVRGEPAARGVSMKGTQVHSIRLPGHVIGVEVVFGQESERLSIRHDAGSGAEPYIGGTLLAAREVGRLRGLHRGLGPLMGLPF
jgi:4-hydroxy-tetrahydrodipicolinate reductase